MFPFRARAEASGNLTCEVLVSRVESLEHSTSKAWTHTCRPLTLTGYTQVVPLLMSALDTLKAVVHVNHTSNRRFQVMICQEETSPRYTTDR